MTALTPSPAVLSRLSPDDVAELRRLVDASESAQRAHGAAAAYAYTRLRTAEAVQADETVASRLEESVSAHTAVRAFLLGLLAQWHRDMYEVGREAPR